MGEIELSVVNLTTTFLVGITCLLLYRYSTRNHDYWKKRGIRYVKPVPFLGNIVDYFKEPFHDIETKRYNELGPIYGHLEGSKPLLSLADPEDLRNILVRDFQYFITRRAVSTGDNVFDSLLSLLHGEDWKRVRTIVSPTFTTGKIKGMLGIFKECSMTLVNNFRKSIENGEAIDAKRLYGTFTIDVIACSAFSIKIDSHNDPENEFVKHVRTVFRTLNWRLGSAVMFPGIMKLLKIKVFPTELYNFFGCVILQIIQERKKTGQLRNDFLQLLMNTAKEVTEEQYAKDEENRDIASNYIREDVDHQTFKSTVSKNLSKDELVAQCLVFFLAGYDTTSNTLSFISYFLALHPDVQEKLRAEVDEAVKENNGELTYEAVQNMKYLDNVISETLRFFPPICRLERTTDRDYVLVKRNLVIEKGTVITIPIHAIHRDSRYFPDPKKFDPDRFSAEVQEKRDRFVFMPFGAGPRNCVGLRFALVQIKVCIAHVLSTFIINKCPRTKVPPEFDFGQLLIQPKEIVLQLQLRKDSLLLK